MNDARDMLEERAQHANRRLQEVRDTITGIFANDDRLTRADDLCIYATGSYARREASPESDLDLFFVVRGSKDTHAVSRTEKTLLDAALIDMIRDLRFPPLSGDARYLEIHYQNDIAASLGGPEDDYHNFFTARLLLLLESVPVHNEQLYGEIVGHVIGEYFRDYDSHTEAFKPVFLVNDIVRFWKTLCLNYEHRRNQLKRDDSPEAQKARAKHQLKNLKLKFSRMLTCFSAVVPLVQQDQVPLDPQRLQELVTTAPIDRLRALGACSPDARRTVDGMLDDYAWFLDLTAKRKDDLLLWISQEEQRTAAYDRAARFGDAMFTLLQLTADPSLLRYVII